MECEKQPGIAVFEDGGKDTMNQGMKAASRSWERQEWVLPDCLQKGVQSSNVARLDFWPWEDHEFLLF